ncbi:hypothetical protein DRJ48_02140 [Candidatus Woesearchaeota archaeon]|nr:MAG: hypothetical protein DRJ48_02140 [Candidatus Woesearchaeota archaeon]
MEIEKLKGLSVGSKLKINGAEYEVVDIDRGIEPCEEVKEWTLKDKEGNEYLLQMVLGSIPDLWRIEIDPISKRPIFSDKNLIEVRSIEF